MANRNGDSNTGDLPPRDVFVLSFLDWMKELEVQSIVMSLSLVDGDEEPLTIEELIGSFYEYLTR